MLQKSLKTPPPKFFLDFMLTKIPTVLSMINKDFLIFFYLKNKSFALVAVEPNLYLFLEYCLLHQFIWHTKFNTQELLLVSTMSHLLFEWARNITVLLVGYND